MSVSGLRQRPFEYGEIFVHPPLPGAAFKGGHLVD
jgi:hypothetical protein